jgi:uncharacterized protein (TIGR03083 family)
MAASSPWPLIHAERAALVADLQQLAPADWERPSLCPGWTVRDVLGHVTSTARMTPPTFFAGLAKAGFRFHQMSAANIKQETGMSPPEQLAGFAALTTATNHPPGPVEAMLGEIVVHSADIRRPLGIAHDYPTEALTRAADFYQKSNLLIGAKNRVAGLALRATDADWSSGTGPEASGPMLSLVLAMTGRPVALDDLSGPGVDLLRTRTGS